MENNTKTPVKLSAEQELILNQLKSELIKENVDFVKFDDFFLLRFLRARKFSLENTKKMFMDFLQWRIDFKTDELIEKHEFNEYLPLQKLYPRFYHKTDKEGFLY